MIPVRSFVKLSDKELASYQTNGLLDADMIEYKSYLLYKNVFEKVKRELRSYKKSLDGCNVNEAMSRPQGAQSAVPLMRRHSGSDAAVYAKPETKQKRLSKRRSAPTNQLCRKKHPTAGQSQAHYLLGGG